MKFNYYDETDSLYIDLSEKKSVDSKEIAKGVVLDLDKDGQVVGIDIDHASKFVNLTNLEAKGLSFEQMNIVQI